ncbi:MAG: O-methyltransferase [Ignavibacteriales bacterium CG_4_9_14_3_um_filter_30_11]|nr:MAG: O-methyltransferase [Ignavibacteriales bacterium CG_4_9_14_3_um_filter_30_11]
MKKIIYPAQLDYISSFVKKNNPLIIEMGKFALENKIPILSKDSSEFLEQIVQIKKPKKVLEIGMAIAYSSIRIAKILSSESVVTTIEINKVNIKIAKTYIKKANMIKKIKVLEGDAEDIIPTIKDKFDLIFLDADKEDYLTLFNLSLEKLKKGGVIFIDNLLWHGFAAAKKIPKKYKNSTKHIRNFNYHFMNSKSLKSVLLPIGDGIGLGIKL